MTILTKIISGGQTGADQGGLDAGRALNIPTGGTAPLGWKTERGSAEELLKGYGLVEAGVPGYPFRTRMNILNSDATVIYGFTHEPGTLLTLRLCRSLGKPFLLNPTVNQLSAAVRGLPIKVLNVAGNRESKNHGIQVRVKNFLVDALSHEY